MDRISECRRLRAAKERLPSREEWGLVGRSEGRLRPVFLRIPIPPAYSDFDSDVLLGHEIASESPSPVVERRAGLVLFRRHSGFTEHDRHEKIGE